MERNTNPDAVAIPRRRCFSMKIREATLMLGVPALLGMALMAGSAGCSRSSATPTPLRTRSRKEAVQAESKAKYVALSLVMFGGMTGRFPSVATWQADTIKYSGRHLDNVADFEYNTALAGKEPKSVKDPARTVLTYETGADQFKSSPGKSAFIGFVDGHVESVDPSTVIWEPK